MASPLELELLKRAMADIEAQAITAPVSSHAPVSTHDILRTQLQDYDRQRAEEMPQGSGPLLTPETDLNEVLGNLIPGGGGAQQAVLAPNAMVRDKAMRARMHDMLRERAEALAKEFDNPQILNAINRFIKTKPIQAAHFNGLDVLLEPQRGNTAGGFVPKVAPHDNPRASMFLNPNIRDPRAMDEAIQHEGRSHLAQHLKLSEQARAEGKADPRISSDIPFSQQYDQLTELAGGYFRNPMESGPRTHTEFRRIHRNDMPAAERRKLARERAQSRSRHRENFDGYLNKPIDAEARIEQVITEAERNKKIPAASGILSGLVSQAPNPRQVRQVDIDEGAAADLIHQLAERLKTVPRGKDAPRRAMTAEELLRDDAVRRYLTKR